MKRPHAESLEREDQQTARKIFWRTLLIWLNLAAILGVLCSGGWVAWQTLGTWSPALMFLAVSIAAQFLMLVALTVTTALWSSIDTLKRGQELNRLRFDVYIAVRETLGTALSPYLPEYRRLGTAINLGEELVKPAEQLSRRAAELQLALGRLFPELKLAEAVNLIMRQALEAQGITADVHEIERVITAITGYAENTNLATQAGQPH